MEGNHSHRDRSLHVQEKDEAKRLLQDVKWLFLSQNWIKHRDSMCYICHLAKISSEVSDNRYVGLEVLGQTEGI